LQAGQKFSFWPWNFKKSGVYVMQEIVVLFGGGDGGGYMILNGRLIPIPPYNPETAIGRAQAVLTAANSLAQAASVNKELSGELTAVAQKLTQEAIGQITRSVPQGFQAKSA
jgi:hypothetical protein